MPRDTVFAPTSTGLAAAAHTVAHSDPPGPAARMSAVSGQRRRDRRGTVRRPYPLSAA